MSNSYDDEFMEELEDEFENDRQYFVFYVEFDDDFGEGISPIELVQFPDAHPIHDLSWSDENCIAKVAYKNKVSYIAETFIPLSAFKSGMQEEPRATMKRIMTLKKKVREELEGSDTKENEEDDEDKDEKV